MLFEGFDEAQVLLLGHMLNPLCCLVMFGQGLAVTAIYISSLLKRLKKVDQDIHFTYGSYVFIFIYVDQQMIS